MQNGSVAVDCILSQYANFCVGQCAVGHIVLYEVEERAVQSIMSGIENVVAGKGGAGRIRFCPSFYRRSMSLLYDMCELVRQQLLTLCGSGFVFAIIEENVVAMCKCLCIYFAGQSHCFVIVMNTHPREITAELFTHFRSYIQWKRQAMCFGSFHSSCKIIGHGIAVIAWYFFFLKGIF